MMFDIAIEFQINNFLQSMGNCQSDSVVKKLLGSCQAVFRWLSGSLQAVVKQWLGGHHLVVGHSSYSFQAVVGQPSNSHTVVM